jgi:ATP-dependent DNA helicase PIF1
MAGPETKRMAEKGIHAPLLELPDGKNPLQNLPSQEETAAEQLYRIMREQHDNQEIVVPTCFLTGSAGCGKTYTAREIIAENPTFAIMAATTGIAGVNLDTTTIHALLKYFDTESLQESYRRGRIQTLLHHLAGKFQNVLIDEASMIDKKQLDIWVDAFAEVNGFSDMAAKGKKLGLILTGDFCQLPPVKADFAFDAESWPLFAKHTMRLTKMWRQSHPEFLQALSHLRAGEGAEATAILKDLVKWRSSVNMKMPESTVIMTKNEMVNRHNKMMLRDLPDPYINVPTRRAGKQLKAWEDPDRNGLIPDILQLKLNAYVMILTNAQTARGFFDFSTKLPYANGDCGLVKGVDVQKKVVVVELKRNGEIEEIPLIKRFNYSKEEPYETMDDGFKPYYDEKAKKWVVGEITYMPLRLAYAATVHKTQGLTLDAIQVDSTAHFFGSPAMAYVALSRARDPKNVYIVGRPESFAKKVKIDPRVIPWL